MVRFYHQHLVEGLDPPHALRSAQLWLRDADVGPLQLAGTYAALYENSARTDLQLFRAMRYYRANPNLKPFAHPYYWAAFVLTGL